MSAYDVAFWGLVGGAGGGVLAYFADEDIRKALQQSKVVLVAGGVLAGLGAGVVLGSRFRIVGTAFDQMAAAARSAL